MNRTAMETVRAVVSCKAADEAQEKADSERHWNPFPQTTDQKIEAELKRLRWRELQAQADGMRRTQQSAAYAAATRLLAENRRNNRKGR